jgi:hypothetical protein
MTRPIRSHGVPKPNRAKSRTHRGLRCGQPIDPPGLFRPPGLILTQQTSGGPSAKISAIRRCHFRERLSNYRLSPPNPHSNCPAFPNLGWSAGTGCSNLSRYFRASPLRGCSQSTTGHSTRLPRYLGGKRNADSAMRSESWTQPPGGRWPRSFRGSESRAISRL